MATDYLPDEIPLIEIPEELKFASLAVLRQDAIALQLELKRIQSLLIVLIEQNRNGY